MPTIRPIRERDANAFMELANQLDHETHFMMLAPGERILDSEKETERIRQVMAQENSTILVAEEGDRLVGYVEASGGEYQRNRHSAYLVAGVLQAWTGQGIGQRLFSALDAWARQHNLHRLELTVMAHNQAAIHLYQKMGFISEGTRRDSLWVDGVFVDEHAMARLLY